MIELVKSTVRGGRLTVILNVPNEALAIVQRYEPLFDEDSAYAEGKWSEFTDLSLKEAAKLVEELTAAGFQAQIVENPYK